MKEKKKRKISKIIFCIVAVITAFMLFATSVFAYQTGIPYTPNVFLGNNTYPFMNVEGITYVTHSSNGNYYLKDIPTDSFYTVYNTSNFVEKGAPLKEKGTSSQTVYNNEVSVAITNPSLMTSGVDYNVRKLPKDDYGLYFENGQIDVVRYYITRSDVTSGSLPYQRAFIKLADTYVPKAFLYDEEIGNIVTPQFRGYKIASWEDYGGYFSLRCQVTGYSNITGKYLSHYININEYQVRQTEVNGYIVHNFGLFPRIRNALPEEFSECEYLYLSSVEFVVGCQENALLGTDNRNDFYYQGFDVIDLYFPSLRPYDDVMKPLEDYYDTSSPELYDVNALLQKNGMRYSTGANVDDELNLSGAGKLIASATRGVLEVTIMPGISLGGILFTVVACGFVVVVLKYFAGG